MESTFSVEMLDIAAKAEEFGLGADELEGLLSRAGVPIFLAGDRKGMTATSWKAHVADSLRCFGNHDSAVGSEDQERNELGRLGDELEKLLGSGGLFDDVPDVGWGTERRKQLAAYPETAQLLEGFKRYVEEQEPGAQLQQNKWTVSIIMPGRRWAGMKPRGYGLYLYATREGQMLEERVEAPEDFQRALDWLRQLPKYK